MTLPQLRRQPALLFRAPAVVVFRLLASLSEGERVALASLTRRRYAKWQFCQVNHQLAAALTILWPQPSVIGEPFTPTTTSGCAVLPASRDAAQPHLALFTALCFSAAKPPPRRQSRPAPSLLSRRCPGIRDRSVGVVLIRWSNRRHVDTLRSPGAMARGVREPLTNSSTVTHYACMSLRRQVSQVSSRMKQVARTFIRSTLGSAASSVVNCNTEAPRAVLRCSRSTR